MALLPPGSEILNQPVSFYYRYKSLVRIAFTDAADAAYGYTKRDTEIIM